MLSVIMVTARRDPGYKFIVESLWQNIQQLQKTFPDAKVEFIAVDENIWYNEKQAREELAELIGGRFPHQHVAPKFSPWRGPLRLTKTDYWDKQSALNSGVCYAKYSRLVFFDDNAVLGEGWLLPHAVTFPSPVAICGSYKYWYPGVTVNGCTVVGNPHEPGDHRLREQPTAGPCHPGWLYGGNCSFPLEQVLETNGWEELLSGYGGLEDSEFSVRISRLARTFFVPDSVVHYLTDNSQIIGDQVGPAVSDAHGIPRAEEAKRCKGFNYKDHNGTVHWFTWNHVPIWWLTSHNRTLHEDGVNYQATYDPTMEQHRSRVKTLGNMYSLRSLRNFIQSGKPFPKYVNADMVDWRDQKRLVDM